MMRNNNKAIVLLLISSFLVFTIIGCGSSGGMNEETPGAGSGSGSVVVPPPVGALSLRAEQYTIPSDNQGYSLVTATVVLSNNSPAVGAVVSFSTNGGLIMADEDEADTAAAPFDPSAVQTDSRGAAKIRLMSGPDRSNRIITVNATAGGTTKSIPIQVVGTTISLDNNNTSLDAEGNKTSTLVITVQDATPSPINDAEVRISVDPEGSLSWAPSENLRTDMSGRLELKITGRQPTGNAVLRIESSGDVKTQTYEVYSSVNIFTITAPAASPYSWSTARDLVVTVRAPQQNTVRFVSSFGQWQGSGSTGQKYIDVPVNAVTKEVSAVLSSAEAGVATIQVFDPARPSVSDTIQVAFSAPSSEACRMSLQASANVVAPSFGAVVNSVELTAKVKNRFDQAVSNVPVLFFLNGATTTGGGERLSPAIAYTDPQGFAHSTFSSGSGSSDAEGVEVSAMILDAGVSDAICNPVSAVRIVIGGSAGAIFIGQSSKIESINSDTTYKLPMSVLVADSNGNPMPNTPVTLKLWPTRYHTGYRTAENKCPIVVTGTFPNEDVNRNLMCDFCTPCQTAVGEDIDNDCELTPPSSAAGSLPGLVQTNADGVAEFYLVYLKESAAWLEDEVVAAAQVYGTEVRSTLTFWLPELVGESCNLPGESPFNPDVPLVVRKEGVSPVAAAVPDAGTHSLIGDFIGIDAARGPYAFRPLHGRYDDPFRPHEG